MVSDPSEVRPIGQTFISAEVTRVYHIKDELDCYCSEHLDPNQYAYKAGVPSHQTTMVTVDGPKSISRVHFLDYSSVFNTIDRQQILDIQQKKMFKFPTI